VSDSRTGAGDPAATLALLWRGVDRAPTSSRRGPRRALSVDAVVAAATALADRNGLSAVTMRSLAQELAIAPMSIYTYVPGRAELLDLMLDAAYAGMTRTPTDDQPWRARVRAVADDNRALFDTHPWAAAISTLRPPLGPGQIAKYEHELAALDGLGLTDVQMDDALSHLLTVVRANTQDPIAARAAQHQNAPGRPGPGGTPPGHCSRVSWTRPPTPSPAASAPPPAGPTAAHTTPTMPTTSASTASSTP